MIKSLVEKQKDLEQSIRKFERNFIEALPKHIPADRFIRTAISTISKNPKIAECKKITILSSFMQAAQLGLEVNTPLQHSSIIPYKDKDGNYEAQFQIMYQGYIELALRSPKLSAIEAREVYENDEFEIVYGLDSNVTHKPTIRGNRGKLIGAYAIAKLIDGKQIFEWMNEEDIEKVRAVSKTAKRSDSPWNTFPASMYRKSVIKRLAKYLPLAIDEYLARLGKAIEIDNNYESGKKQEIDNKIMGVLISEGEVEEDYSEAPESKTKKMKKKLKDSESNEQMDLDAQQEIEDCRRNLKNDLACLIEANLAKEADWIELINNAKSLESLEEIKSEFDRIIEIEEE